MAQRPRSHVLETTSRNRLERLFTDEGWTVQAINPDYGEDLLVRIFENGVASPYYFYVQVKATDELERFRTTNNVLGVSVPTTTAKTWEELAQPLFLVLWDASADVWYWCHVQTFLQSQDGKDIISRGEASVRFPITNQLTSSNLAALTGIVQEVTTWSTKAYQSWKMLKERHDSARLAIFGTAALTDVSEQPNTPIVMIDEVEASLHPAAARKMLELLETPNIQLGLRLRDLSGKELYSSKRTILNPRKPSKTNQEVVTKKRKSKRGKG